MWTVTGHRWAIELLAQSLQQGRLSHAYLLVGTRRVGKMTLAMNLAQAVNCLGEDRPLRQAQDRP